MFKIQSISLCYGIRNKMTEKTEQLNGKAAMLGMFALVGAYYFTNQVLPEIF